jgi:magnesium transporter
MFADDTFDIADRENMDRLFEIIGFSVTQMREASPFRAFRFPFHGFLPPSRAVQCCLTCWHIRDDFSQDSYAAFFLTLVLGLGESVSIQSMTLSIHSLDQRAGLVWYLKSFYRR